MMLKVWMLGLCCAAAAWGQTASPTIAPGTVQVGGARATHEDESASVAMDAPVLTIKGFCPGQTTDTAGGDSAGKPCQTVITRAQFEQIAHGVQPVMTRSVKQQLAGVYPRLLVMSTEADAEGLNKDPQVEAQITMARMQILTQALTRKLQQEHAKVTEQDISDYYQNHPEVSEEYTLQRLVVPLRKEQPPATDASKATKLTPEEQAARDQESEEKMTRLAESLQKRAAAGEDLLKLQKEAFAAAGVKVEAPNVSMGTVRRTALPASHTVIFTMKAADVSPVVTDSGGHYIYKLESKNKLQLDEVHTEIRIMLSSQRMKEAVDKLQGSFTAEKNEAYFGPAHPAPETPDAPK